MNHNQKLGYILLGAGIMALGITIGQVITPNIEAQNNGVFNEIVCRRLNVVDKNGNNAISLVSEETGNAVAVYDSNKKTGSPVLSLASVPEGNMVFVLDKKGKFAVNLTTSPIDNTIFVYDKTGKPVVSLTSAPKGNWVSVTSPNTGEPVVALSSTPTGNTVSVHNKWGTIEQLGDKQ